MELIEGHILLVIYRNFFRRGLFHEKLNLCDIVEGAIFLPSHMEHMEFS